MHNTSQCTWYTMINTILASASKQLVNGVHHRFTFQSTINTSTEVDICSFNHKKGQGLRVGCRHRSSNAEPQTCILILQGSIPKTLELRGGQQVDEPSDTVQESLASSGKSKSIEP